MKESFWKQPLTASDFKGMFPIKEINASARYLAGREVSKQQCGDIRELYRYYRIRLLLEHYDRVVAPFRRILANIAMNQVFDYAIVSIDGSKPVEFVYKTNPSIESMKIFATNAVEAIHLAVKELVDAPECGTDQCFTSAG